MQQTSPLSQGNLEYLLQCSIYNDSLLQTYRSFMLMLESVLLAVGTGLCVAVIAIDDLVQSISLAIIIVTLGVLSLYVLRILVNVITARGLDVNHWHRALIRAEQRFPSEVRFFTRFKIYQSQQRSGQRPENDAIPLESVLTEEEIHALVSDRLGHTRRIIDRWLPRCIAGVWGVLLTMVLGWVTYRCIEAII